MEGGGVLASGLSAGEAMAGVLSASPAAMELHLPLLLSNQVLLTSIAILVTMALSAWLLRVSRPNES